MGVAVGSKVLGDNRDPEGSHDFLCPQRSGSCARVCEADLHIVMAQKVLYCMSVTNSHVNEDALVPLASARTARHAQHTTTAQPKRDISTFCLANDTANQTRAGNVSTLWANGSGPQHMFAQPAASGVSSGTGPFIIAFTTSD